MSRKAQFVLGIAALSALAVGLLAARMSHRTPLPALEVALWYWHSPFRITKAERAQLESMGVRSLFVRAGTFRRSGVSLRLALPQVWESRTEGIVVHLVFNFGPELLREFGKADNSWMAGHLCREIERELGNARQSGVNTLGIQLDFDCPTRLLNKYAELVRQIRSDPAFQRLSFSATALPTWLKSGGIHNLAKVVDFLVPQFYEAETSRNVAAFKPISSLATLERDLKAAGRLGIPFYAGVPAYGHALVFDGGGKLLGAYHDMGVMDALRHPALRQVKQFAMDSNGRSASARTFSGEELVILAPKDMHPEDPGAHDAPDHGMGRRPYYLAYDCPTPVMSNRYLRVIQAQRPANCRGIIFFRYPERGEVSALPLRSLQAAINRAELKPRLNVAIREGSVPFEAIEAGGGSRSLPIDLTINVTNDGASATQTAPGAVEMKLRFDRPGIDAASPGGFDSIVAYYQSNDKVPMRSSIARANLLVFRGMRLGAGEQLLAGPIRVPPGGPRRCEGEWTAKIPGGFETVQGSICPVELKRQ